MTLIDELTGLYNRRGFFLLAEQELKLAEQRSLSFSLFFADMDNLKVINDEMGHEMGDRAIIDVARHLRSSFRKADVIARLGGDEFVCFALTSDEEANLIAERLDRAIADFNLSQQRPYELSLSYGRVSYDDLHGLSLCDLVQEADVKMYEVKSRKKLALEKLK